MFFERVPRAGNGACARPSLRSYPGLLWGLSSVLARSYFIFSLEAVFLSFLFLSFLSRFLFVGSLCLALLQPAIRTRLVSVPNDDSKSVKRNECTQSNLRVQQADPSPGPGTRRSKSLFPRIRLNADKVFPSWFDRCSTSTDQSPNVGPPRQ
jgi:hypothetical protein